MDLFMAICQAIGLAIAVGVGGPLAWLFIAVMASLGAGFDPEGTDWEVAGAEWFVVLLFAVNVLAFYLRRRDPYPRRRSEAIAAGVLAALFGAAALAAEGEPAVIGILAGAAIGPVSSLLASDVLHGAQRRAEGSSDAGDAASLGLLFGLTGIAIAALGLFAPPAALVVLAALALLALRRRSRAGEKYEGLRILR